MGKEGFKRKPTALFSADVFGYNRLTNLDEASTVKRLTTYQEIMIRLIKQQLRRIGDTPGDNIIA